VWSTFIHITMPLVKPALLVAVLFRILDTLRIFDLPFVLVGPNKESVETLSILAFLEANQTRYGPAAAYATLLFIYVAVVAYVFVKLLGADVFGDAIQRKPKKKNGNGGRGGRKQDASKTPVVPGLTAGGGGGGA
jgi:multiple sugar transport system permease protein